mgnify:CR=1 FL=1
MPKYVVERNIPNVEKLSTSELKGMSQKSCSALEVNELNIQWLISYVAENKMYCVYIAPDKETVAKHAKLKGLPANVISEVSSVIDPSLPEWK